MSKLANVLNYIFKKYPVPNSLNPRRITRMIYLADWKAALELGKQITNIKWRIVDFEPVIDTASIEELVAFVERRNRRFLRQLMNLVNELATGEMDVLDFVIQAAEHKTEEELARLVYSTYPAMTQDESDKVNLSNLAQQYKEVKPKFFDSSSLQPQ